MSPDEPHDDGTHPLIEALHATQEIPWNIRASLLLLGLYLAAALRLLASPTWIPIGDLGVLLVVASSLVPSLWSVRIGVALIGIASTGIPVATHASLDALIVLVTIGLPFLALVVLASRLDPEAPPRPPLPSKVGLRIGIIAVVLLAVLFAPLLFAPTRALWRTEAAPAISVLFLAGASLALLAPHLVDRDVEPHRIDARGSQGDQEPFET